MQTRQLLILIAIMILPSLAFSADDALEFRVKLDVRGDESLENRIEKFLSRELRALGNVIQSEDKYEYDITILGAKLQNVIGDEMGIVLSVNIHTKFDNIAFSSMFKKEFMKEGIALTNDLYYYPKHWVRSGSVHDLQSICRRIIADFDSQILQKQRDAIKEGRIFDLDK
jgi:hypothetical protein